MEGEGAETPGPTPGPSRVWRYKDTLYLGLGSVLLLGGALGVTALTTAPPLNSTWKLGRTFTEVLEWHVVSSRREN